MSWLGSTWFVVSLYLVVALTVVILGWKETARRREGDRTARRPIVWFGMALLLIVMAVGRATDTAEIVADIGRRAARSEGWYEGRRIVQAGLIGAAATGLSLVVVFIAVALWRVPSRRQRYVPTLVAVGGLLFYAASRIVSLHQIDETLQDGAVGGLTVGALIEMTLLIGALVTVAVRLGSSRRSHGADGPFGRPVPHRVRTNRLGTSQTRTVESSEVITEVDPSGEIAASRTATPRPR